MKHFDLIRRAEGCLGKLHEVGKKISKANASKLRRAWQEISEILALVDAETTATEAERSQREREQLLRKAVRHATRVPGQEYGPWCYLMDVFDASLVYCLDDVCYQCDYSIADDGTVTLGGRIPEAPRAQVSLFGDGQDGTGFTPNPAGVAAPPAVGTVEDGYRYNGGDPASPSSWSPVR